ncbi:ABC transporter permease [Xinfangfangia pollutisoli]|uniref:ABC transporter permease n=1 Tax=Xinfangfangia pollutisoli TaxID=2865960 RepID=UPI001CD788F2|nr:ABC transporter permease [Xinfangfangia pollutisoli]
MRRPPVNLLPAGLAARMTNLVLSLIVPATLLIGWEAAAAGGYIDEGAFSRPSSIARAGIAAILDGSLLTATLQTLQAAGLGLLVGAVTGAVLGVFLGLQPMAEIATRPTVEMLRAIPAIAFTPLALLVFGFGLALQMVIVAYATAWPVMVAALAATRGIDRRLLEVADVLEMGLARRLRVIILPAVFGRIVVGLRTAMGFALVVSVTVEILANPRGLGYQLILAQQSFRPDLMYACIVWLAGLGAAAGALSNLLNRFSTEMAR